MISHKLGAVIHNAPPPPRARSGRAGLIYQFSDMLVGSAFFFPDDMGKTKDSGSRRMKSITNCASQWKKNHKYSEYWEFVIRVMPAGTVLEDGTKFNIDTVGCWRMI